MNSRFELIIVSTEDIAFLQIRMEVRTFLLNPTQLMSRIRLRKYLEKYRFYNLGSQVKITSTTFRNLMG